MQNRPINTNEMVYGITFNIKTNEYERMFVDHIIKYTDDGHAYIKLTNGTNLCVDVNNLFFSKEDMDLAILKRKGMI